MDVLGNLVGGQACAADGTTASRNPISRLVDSLMEGSAGGGQMKVPSRRAFGPQQQQGGRPMVRGPPGAAAAAAYAHAQAHAQAQGMMGPMMGPRGNASHPQQSDHHPYQDNSGWANEFEGGNRGPPPPMIMQEHHRQDFEGAWGAGPGLHPRPPPPPPPGAMMAARGPGGAGAGWANEFHGPGVREPMMHQPHPAELEAAWGAPAEGRFGPGPGPMLYGPAGPLPPPALGPGFAAPGMNGQVTSATSTASPTTTGVVASNSTSDVHNEVVGGGEGTEAKGVGVVGAGVDEGEGEEVSASARALAGQMASDPDGRFRDSELLRFASRLGTGGLRVSGDKVLQGREGALGFDEAWAGEGAPVVTQDADLHAAYAEDEADQQQLQQQQEEHLVGSFSDAWTGLDSGVGVREEPSLKPSAAELSSAVQEEAWSDSKTSDLAPEFRETMEAAWREVEHGGVGAGAGVGDPDLQAVWDDQDDAAGVETLEGVWGRTAARLEAGEGGLEAPYELNADNKFLELENPFEEGVRLFEEGQIADAALCFEAEIARNPENSQAWFMLGQSHAENDQDRLAISCLERAVEMDPYSLDALLALGTSYVNELDSQKALHNLKAWVEHNPKYSGLEIAVDEYSDGTLMDEVMQLMLQAQRWDAADADAHVVLGVLYNVSRDYDSAAEAFRRAIEARPNDHSLWNKLGATLANNRQSEDALPAYRRAIASKPGYARAWLNMGISQANLNRCEEASSCYLQALRLNPEAKHIWSYLRIVFTSMERYDLVQKAGQENARLFEDDFDLALPTLPP
ncbi:unnamed protein product [Pylaiella littoralis]